MDFHRFLCIKDKIFIYQLETSFISNKIYIPFKKWQLNTLNKKHLVSFQHIFLGAYYLWNTVEEKKKMSHYYDLHEELKHKKRINKASLHTNEGSDYIESKELDCQIIFYYYKAESALGGFIPKSL